MNFSTPLLLGVRAYLLPTLLLLCLITIQVVPYHSSPKSSIRMQALRSANKIIYGMPGSGWASPEWHWGSAQGTGHDCAAICRRRYASRGDRHALVHELLSATVHETNAMDIEELKLILGLVFQRGRWDGSDGGPGGYRAVLDAMAQAERYEGPNDQVAQRNLVEDLANRYNLLLEKMSAGDQKALAYCMQQSIQNVDCEVALRRCSGLVLQAMGFVEKGC